MEREQSNTSVSEYDEKFKDMDAYSRQAIYTPNELWKIDQFIFALNANVAHSVSQREFTTYAECLRKCYVSENSLKRIQDEKNRNKASFKEQGRWGQHQKPRNSQSMKKYGYVDRLAIPPQCDKCKRRHNGECYGIQKTCYNCGSPDHFKKDFPVPNKTKGRVFTLDARKSKGNTNLVTATCYVNNQPLSVLVDCGATHSFISNRCV